MGYGIYTMSFSHGIGRPAKFFSPDSSEFLQVSTILGMGSKSHIPSVAFKMAAIYHYR